MNDRPKSDGANLTLEEGSYVTRAPYHQWLGLKFSPRGRRHRADREVARGVGGEPERRFTHGGILAALIDLGAHGDGAQTGRGVPTIDMRVDYHAVALRASPIKGRLCGWGRSSRCRARIFDAQGKLLASGRGTYYRAAPPKDKRADGRVQKPRRPDRP